MDTILKKGIPISVSLEPTIEAENMNPALSQDKRRLIRISIMAFAMAVVISFIAKLLVYLIDLFTNIAFFGSFSFAHHTPADNQLGLWVIAIPVIGGLIVGLMAVYGSKAIRGHGIPEAMEQILTNKSKIRPSITYLKPLSAAVSIGTGGPFGAEGPIIAWSTRLRARRPLLRQAAPLVLRLASGLKSRTTSVKFSLRLVPLQVCRLYLVAP